MNKKYLSKNAINCLFAIIFGLLSCALAQGVIEVKIAGPNDDAEELIGESAVGPAGSAYLDSSDLELVDDADTTQIVGLRFTGLELAPNTPITRAYIQFTVDEPTSDPASLTIYGEASDNAAPFTNTSQILSSRTPTALSIPWSPASWTEQGAAAQAQQTPDLSALIQEIVNRPGWQSGNALVLMLTGEGKRVAESFDGSQNGAAVLRVEFETPAAQVEETDAEMPATPTNEEATEESSGETASPAEATQTTPETATPETMPEPETEPEPTETATQPETTETVQAPAPQPDPENGKRYALTGENVTGSALVTDYGNGTVIVTVLVNAQARNDVYGARLNIGSCSAPGTLLLDLEPVRGDRGSLSVTASEVDYATLTQSDLSLTLLSSPESNEVIACGEVGAP